MVIFKNNMSIFRPLLLDNFACMNLFNSIITHLLQVKHNSFDNTKIATRHYFVALMMRLGNYLPLGRLSRHLSKQGKQWMLYKFLLSCLVNFFCAPLLLKKILCMGSKHGSYLHIYGVLGISLEFNDINCPTKQEEQKMYFIQSLTQCLT